MSLSLAVDPRRFSVITLAEADSDLRAWSERLRWPAMGDDHVALRVGRDTQLNLLGAQLDAAVHRADRAVLLVADGISCYAASWWARLSPRDYVDRVAGALLFDPHSGATPERRRPFASPPTPLPFPSVVVADGGDDEVRAIADGWGSRLVDGRRQRIAERTERAAWHNAQALFQRLTKAVVDRDVRTALVLAGRMR